MISPESSIVICSERISVYKEIRDTLLSEGHTNICLGDVVLNRRINNKYD